MRYYDNAFRKNLIDMLNTYRRILSQMELSQDKNFSNIFISDSIKKIDEAVKIIKPSAFDFLTEKKIEKLQTSEYLKQEIEKIQKEFEVKEKQLEQELKSLKAQKGQEEQNARRNQINERIRKLRERAGATINANEANTDTERKTESTTDGTISEDTETLIRQARIGIDSATAREKDSGASRVDREAERERQAIIRSQQEAERSRAEAEKCTTSENIEDNAFTDFDDEDNIPPVE